MTAASCKPATPPSRLSPVFASGAKAGAKPGERPCDPMAYRRIFRDRWADFLHAHFSNHLHVAVFFNVDESTARAWWNHINQPQGWVVSFACETIPGALDELRCAA